MAEGRSPWLSVSRPTQPAEAQALELGLSSPPIQVIPMAFPSVSKQQLENLAVPLPPLAEQHRIAARVDELMALCDQIEAGLGVADGTRSRLLDSLLLDPLESAQPNARPPADSGHEACGKRMHGAGPPW